MCGVINHGGTVNVEGDNRPEIDPSLINSLGSQLPFSNHLDIPYAPQPTTEFSITVSSNVHRGEGLQFPLPPFTGARASSRPERKLGATAVFGGWCRPVK